MLNGKNLPTALHLEQFNEIPVLVINHEIGQAQIALQGAQLLSWKPKNQQEILWLSEIEPFTLGDAIRGGIPLCYPWFGNTKKPAHGTARLRLWELSTHDIQTDKISLTFSLFSENHLPEAQLQMIFSHKLQLIFTHLAEEPAEAALHSYFRVGNIQQTEILGLPTTCFNKLAEQTETVPSPRKITQAVDCIYTFANTPTMLIDESLQRTLTLNHQNTSDIVLWNPWKNPPSAMQPNSYQQMICIETARIQQKLHKGESFGVEIA